MGAHLPRSQRFEVARPPVHMSGADRRRSVRPHTGERRPEITGDARLRYFPDDECLRLPGCGRSRSSDTLLQEPSSHTRMGSYRQRPPLQNARTPLVVTRAELVIDEAHRPKRYVKARP